MEGVHSEAVARDLPGASDETLRAAVLADAPELLALLPDLTSSLADVRKRTAPLLAELRATPDLVTRDGMSYLDAKHLLLLMYSIHILFYILLKLDGQPVREHPVMQRLLAAKTYLEKLKGLDKRLRHQVEKLLRAAKVAAAAGGAAGEAGAEEDPMSFRANPGALVSKLDEDMEGGEAYRPPKLTSVTMEEEELRGGRAARQAERSERAELRRARQSAFVRDLEAEVMGAPEEEAAVGAVGGARDASNLELLKQQQRLEARAAAEEDLMVCSCAACCACGVLPCVGLSMVCSHVGSSVRFGGPPCWGCSLGLRVIRECVAASLDRVSRGSGAAVLMVWLRRRCVCR